MVHRLTSLDNLLIEQLQDLYSAENQMIVALPQMVEAGTSVEVKQILEENLQETKQHIERLEAIFAVRPEPLRGRKCQGMEGILNEALSLVQDHNAEPKVLDAGMVGVLKQAKHYEIAGYSTAIAYAEQLSQDDVISALEETLEEERRTSKKLDSMVKSQAIQAADVEA